MGPVRVVAVGATVLLGLVVDTTVLSRLGLPYATPSVLLLIVVAAGLLGGPREGTAAGLAGGLLVDVAPPSDSRLGTWALAYAVAGAVAGSMHRRTWPATSQLAAAAAGASSALVLAVTTIVLTDTPVGWDAGVPVVLASAAYAAVLSTVVIPVLVRLDRRLRPKPPWEGRRGAGAALR